MAMIDITKHEADLVMALIYAKQKAILKVANDDMMGKEFPHVWSELWKEIHELSVINAKIEIAIKQ